MSSIPLDFQRRCERRWAAGFSPPMSPFASQQRGPEKENQQISAPEKNKQESALQIGSAHSDSGKY